MIFRNGRRFIGTTTNSTAGLFARDWNTSKVAKGRHTLTATARDAAGRTITVARAVRVCK